MIIFVCLLSVFGVGFFLGNKIPILHVWANHSGWWAQKLKKFLACPFCQGFWVGLLFWFGSLLTKQPLPTLIFGYASSGLLCFIYGLLWSFACATFCYALYAFIVWLEDSPTAMSAHKDLL